MNIYDILETRPSRLNQTATDYLRSHGSTRNFTAGDIVLEEGAPSDAVYILLDGIVEIRKRDSIGNTIVIAVADRGTLFGEMGVFLNIRRSATIAAKSDLTLLELSHERFLEALQQYPDMTFRLLKSLSGRLNHLNERYVGMVNNKTMIMVGAYIIELLDTMPPGRSEITLYMTKLLKKTELEHIQSTNALANYKRLNIISNFKMPDDDVVSFKVNISILRSYLSSICLQPIP